MYSFKPEMLTLWLELKQLTGIRAELQIKLLEAFVIQLSAGGIYSPEHVESAFQSALKNTGATWFDYDDKRTVVKLFLRLYTYDARLIREWALGRKLLVAKDLNDIHENS